MGWDDYLSRQQVANRLGVTAHRVDALRREGQLEGVRSPAGWLYHIASVVELELARTEPPVHWRHKERTA